MNISRQHAIDVDAPAPTAEEVAVVPEQMDRDPPTGRQYALSEKYLSREDGVVMLDADRTFLDFIVAAAITPTHLTTTGCAVSPLADSTQLQYEAVPQYHGMADASHQK